MAPSYASISSVSAGLVAEQSSARKLVKYSELAINHILVLTYTVYIFYFILTHTNLLITIGINNI